MLPKSLRKKGKKHLTESAMKQYKQMLCVESLSVQPWKIDKMHSVHTEKLYCNVPLNAAWENVDRFIPFMKRIFHLKYNFEFDRIRSNKMISELMCCSEEHVRKTLLKGFLILKKNQEK